MMKPCWGSFIWLVAIQAAIVSAQPIPQTGQSGPDSIVVPAGTRMQLILNNHLSTKNSRTGDTFYAVVDFPVFIGHRLAIPADSLIRGSVRESKRAGRIRGRSRMALSLHTLMLINGVSREIDAEIFAINDAYEAATLQGGNRVEGPSSKERDAGILVATAARGAVIGAIAGEGKGLAIGSAAGSLVGLSILLATRGRDVILDRGLNFEMILLAPLQLSGREVDFSKAPIMPARSQRSRNGYQSPDRHWRRDHHHDRWPYYFPPIFCCPW